MSKFSSLTTQKLLRFLWVSIVSFKESKRTFLTSDGVQTFKNMMNMSNWSIMSIFSSLTIQKLLCLLSIFIGSIKEAKRTFLTPVVGDSFRWSLEVYKNGIIPFQTSHIFTLQYCFRTQLCQIKSNFSFLPTLVVLHLIHVPILSSKEAKGTFLTHDGV